MKKALLLSLLLFSALLAECYEPPSICGEKYQTTYQWQECYVQNKYPQQKGYYQTTYQWQECYVQDQYQWNEGYVQDQYQWNEGFVKDKTIFGFSNN
jgi:hypothetical protein